MQALQENTYKSVLAYTNSRCAIEIVQKCIHLYLVARVKLTLNINFNPKTDLLGYPTEKCVRTNLQILH